MRTSRTFSCPRAAAHSRLTISVEHEDAKLANTAVSATIESIDGVGIIVERAMWWPGSNWYEAHNSPGTTSTGTAWAMAEGEEGGQDDTQTYILIANTSASAGSAVVTLMFEDGTSEERTISLLPHSRTNVGVRDFFPQALGRRFGALVSVRAVPRRTSSSSAPCTTMPTVSCGTRVQTASRPNCSELGRPIIPDSGVRRR